MSDELTSIPRGSPLLRVMTTVDRAIWKLELTTLVIACAALIAIMMLVFLDAVLRYAFNSPLTFTADLVTLYLISCALLLVLSYTLRRGGHISVDLFVHLLPQRLYHVLIGAALLCSVGVVGIMAHETTWLTWDSFQRKEVPVGIYQWPLWVGKALVAFSLIVLDVRLLHVGLSHLIAGLTGISGIAIPIAHADLGPVEEV